LKFFQNLDYQGKAEMATMLHQLGASQRQLAEVLNVSVYRVRRFLGAPV